MLTDHVTCRHWIDAGFTRFVVSPRSTLGDYRTIAYGPCSFRKWPAERDAEYDSESVSSLSKPYRPSCSQ